MNSKQVYFISFDTSYTTGDTVQLPKKTLVCLNYARILRLVYNLNSWQKDHMKGIYLVRGRSNVFDDMGEMSFLKKPIKTRISEVCEFDENKAREIILRQQKTGVAQKVFADQIQKVC